MDLGDRTRRRLLNVRPHWAKPWQQIRFRGKDATDHLREVAYFDRLPEFSKDLASIAAQGGYAASDLRTFSNPLLGELVTDVFG